MSTENVAYEKRYKDWRRHYDYLFVQANRRPKQDECINLIDGYVVNSEAYVYEGDINFYGSENKLLNKNGEVLYVWRNLDSDAEFCTMFRHKNGKHYLIFRIELYGYSVFELESRTEVHYVPSKVHPNEGQKSEEVFIWTSADYDADSNFLAVTGCIWACPYSTIEIDFSEPLSVQGEEKWLDVRKVVDSDNSIFDDIEFVRWESDVLLLRGNNVEDGQWKEVCVSVEQLQMELLQ